MTTDPDKPWRWGLVLLVWSLIAFGVLFAGGVAFRAYANLVRPGSMDFGLSSFWCPLFLFSAGGGLTIGLLILTWWLVVQRGFSWTLGFVVLALVLFAVFVWPSRFAYYRGGEEDACKLLRVERWTGQGECLEPPGASGTPGRSSAPR